MHLIRHIFKPGQATTLNDVMRNDPPPHSPFSQCGFWCVLHSSLFSFVSEPHHQGPQLSVHGLQRYHLSWNHQQLPASHFDKVSFCILQFATSFSPYDNDVLRRPSGASCSPLRYSLPGCSTLLLDFLVCLTRPAVAASGLQVVERCPGQC